MQLLQETSMGLASFPGSPICTANDKSWTEPLERGHTKTWVSEMPPTIEHMSLWSQPRYDSMYEPQSQAHAVFGCRKNAEGLVSFLTCVLSIVERW